MGFACSGRRWFRALAKRAGSRRLRSETVDGNETITRWDMIADGDEYKSVAKAAFGGEVRPFTWGQEDVAGNYVEAFRITETGDVGINVDEPDQALHVDGNILAIRLDQQSTVVVLQQYAVYPRQQVLRDHEIIACGTLRKLRIEAPHHCIVAHAIVFFFVAIVTSKWG